MQDLPEPSIEKLSRVTKLLRTQRTLPARLEAVVAILKRAVPACHAAGISLLIEGEPTTSAVTDRLAVEIDLRRAPPAYRERRLTAATAKRAAACSQPSKALSRTE